LTELLYQTDSYIKEFDATVTSILREKNAFILNRSAFYPGGGGQAYDFGTVRFNNAEAQLKRAKHSPEGLLHILKDGEPLPEPGQEIKGIIDWERRYQLMRTHTAMHILCGIIFNKYGALVTGGDMQPLKGRMDFEFENLTKDLVGSIEAAINKEVEAKREIRVAIHPREEAFQIPDLIRTKINLLPEHIKEVRTVEIVGLDLQADGGTHVHNTEEIGPIQITDYKSKGKNNKKIYFELRQ